MGEKFSKPLSLEMLKKRVDEIRNNSWNYKIKPFKILDNIYYVGNEWVGAYLIDTGEGLILLDSNFQEVIWILLENIRKLGFDPANIKILLLSHGHFDHIGGARYIQEISHCKTYYPQGDYFFLKERRDLIAGDVPDFKIDEFYNYEKSIVLGNTKITPIHTPGHTPGCTSIMFNSTFCGKTYLVGAHGGLGQNGLSKEELRQNGLPLHLQQDYLESLKRLALIPIDVFLPLHNSYYDILSLAKQDDGSGKMFIQPGDWKAGMETRIRMFEEFLRKEAKNNI